jgi:hypothetical protein
MSSFSGYQGKWLDTALSESCSIDGALSDGSAQSYTLQCLPLPPDREKDDTRTAFLLYDPNDRAQVGYQLVHDSTSYVIDEVHEQKDFRKIICESWTG